MTKDIGKPRIDDTVGSLTGFDEIAIQSKFGADLSALTPTMTMRAIGYVLLRRDGMGDKDAYGEIMRRTLTDTKDMFDASDAGDGEGND